MKRIAACGLLVAIMAAPALADTNQFNNWQRNRQYNQNGNGYPPPPPPPGYYHKKKHKNNNNYNDDAAWAIGGFLGGLLLGQAVNPGYGYAAVPPPVAYCGTAWRMEPDGFGGWQQTPYTVCQ